MITVTPLAKEKLRETLRDYTADPSMAIRITFDPSVPGCFELVLDKEKIDDQVVKTGEGVKVLLVQSHLAKRLEGFILDYEESLDDFTILKVTRH